VARVLGIGGVFFKSEDTDKLQGWYRQHMGLPTDGEGYTLFKWRDIEHPDREHATVWSPFPHDTDYFNPTKAEYMINYIVDDLDGMRAQLREAGAQVDEKVEEYEYGRFGWAVDPDGTRFELWEPPSKSRV
jgi:catechol 2,3-dioxygenase-like lactoylglutathione lyase family enzyme